MKAILLRQFGGPEMLNLEDAPTPIPGPGEVLIQVHAVSVNRTLDLLVRQSGDGRGVTLPHVLGVDPSGVIDAVGHGVEHLQVGDRVAVLSSIRCGLCAACQQGWATDCPNATLLGIHRWGGYAEYVSAPADSVIRIPDKLSFAEATVVTRHFPAAFNLLLDQANLQSGEWVLVMGAAGALGGCGVQVAKLVGAAVIAGAGSDERVAAAMSYGADHGINYRTHDLAEEVLRFTDSRGVDLVFENVGDPALWPGSFNSLARDGRLVTAGAHGGGLVTLDLRRLYMRRLRIIGSTGSTRKYAQRSLEEAAAGRIRAVVGRVIPLRQAAEAHRLVESNAIIGKIILDPTRD